MTQDDKVTLELVAYHFRQELKDLKETFNEDLGDSFKRVFNRECDLYKRYLEFIERQLKDGEKAND